MDGLVQDCSNSSALAMELLQFCTKPSLPIWHQSHILKTQQISVNGGFYKPGGLYQQWFPLSWLNCPLDITKNWLRSGTCEDNNDFIAD